MPQWKREWIHYSTFKKKKYSRGFLFKVADCEPNYSRKKNFLYQPYHNPKTWWCLTNPFSTPLIVMPWFTILFVRKRPNVLYHEIIRETSMFLLYQRFLKRVVQFEDTTMQVLEITCWGKTLSFLSSSSSPIKASRWVIGSTHLSYFLIYFYFNYYWRYCLFNFFKSVQCYLCRI